MNYTPISHQHSDQQKVATVLCCNCGTPMDGSGGLVMCYECIKLTCDITTNIPREAHISFCRNCERFLQPPGQWVAAQLESRELLAICLKRLKGLTKDIRLVDASFIWTEPHSRRIKVKITVQGEAIPNTIIQQTFEVEYVVIAMQCADCAKSYTTHTWRAAVQIRQKVPHKRTFLYLEQLILKHNAHVDTISIQESRDGLDFFYNQKNHAVRMIDFLNSCVPIKYKKSEELISQDTHTGASTYKFTYSVEIAPICRDDLVVLPKKIARNMGDISQFVICSKVSNSLQFLDPSTLKTCDLPATVYYRQAFDSLAEASQLIEFVVLDVEPTSLTKGKHVMAEVQLARASDLGVNDQVYYTKTHLGAILHPGDSAMGYFIANSNYNSELFDSLKFDYVPDVVLIKKQYARRGNRYWKLKRMAKEHKDIEAGNDYSSRQQKQEMERAEKDYELFLQELEEDDEMRQGVNMYKSTKDSVDAEPQYDEGGNEIDLDELLNELDDMEIGQDEDIEGVEEEI